MQWLRLYHELLYDRKIVKIARTEQQPKSTVLGAWIGILILASESPERGHLLLTEGVPLDKDEIGDALDLHGSDLEYLLNAFINCRMLHTDGNCLIVTNWDKRQFKSDDSGERVKRYRAKQRNVSVTLHSNDHVTAPEAEAEADTETDTDKDKDEEGAPAPIAIYCDTVGQWPSPTNQEIIADRLGQTVDKAALEKAFNIWVVDRQYAATNYSGILDYYENIKANAKWHPDTKPSANGSHKETGTERAARLMKELANE